MEKVIECINIIVCNYSNSEICVLRTDCIAHKFCVHKFIYPHNVKDAHMLPYIKEYYVCIQRRFIYKGFDLNAGLI